MPERSLGREFSAILRTGTVKVSVDRSCVPPESLFGFAERRNPKRSFLFVSKVLGRHIPVTPKAMNATYDRLAAMLPTDLPGPVLVIGMAETAVGLGAGVHRAYARSRGLGDAIYIATTRHPMGTPILARFEEEHSHATGHIVHEPVDRSMAEMARGARTLILVDDEASTGRTFANLRAALAEAGLDQVERAVTVTLTDWSGGAAASAIGGESVALLSGTYEWIADPGATPPEMPDVDVVARGEHPLDPGRDRGRLGIVEHDPTGRVPDGKQGERVLVLATGEHVWGPFLVAEAMASAGFDVSFSSCTRSPIAIGHAIESAISFSDNYGLNIANFVYNVRRDDWDRIILCTETPASSVDPALVAALSPEILFDAEDAA
jgi:adenine/guanine phosphoribosyltransferase-like PRPP-binding protein